MGKEIVYCEGCGKRLTEDEFVRGRAHTVDNRPYCVECRPLEAPPPPPPVKPLDDARGKPATTRIPVPPSTRRQRSPAPGGAPSRTPLLVVGTVGGFVLAVLVLIVLTSGGRRSSPRPVPAPEPPRAAASNPVPPPPPVEDRAPRAMKKLQEFASTSQDPEAILLRCDEARPLLKGTPFEAKFLEIEGRALEARKAKGNAARLDNFLAQIRDLREQDKTFVRKEEILRMLRSAADMAGARRAEAEQAIAEYGKAFEEAAAQAAEAARSEAVKLAGEKKFPEALARIDGYPESFRKTPHAAPLAALREELAKKMPEWEAERKLWPWNLWRITSGKEREAPCRLDAHEGRSNVYLTHPVSREAPASLEREFEIPAGKRATLSFWVTHHGLGDWELRVIADGKMLLKQAVGPKATEWRMVRLDLTPFAGRKFLLRLENAATEWIWEFGYWSDIEVKVEGEEGVLVLTAGAARLFGKSLQLSGPGPDQHLMGWNTNGDRAEWPLEVPKAGRYAVEIVYSCGVPNSGEYAVTAGDDRLAGKIAPTGSWDKVETATVGTILLPQGSTTLVIRATNTGGGLMNLRKVRLVPAP